MELSAVWRLDQEFHHYLFNTTTMTAISWTVQLTWIDTTELVDRMGRLHQMGGRLATPVVVLETAARSACARLFRYKRPYSHVRTKPVQAVPVERAQSEGVRTTSLVLDLVNTGP